MKRARQAMAKSSAFERARGICRSAVRSIKPLRGLLLWIVIGSLALLLLPDMPGNADLVVKVVWWLFVCIALGWHLARLLLNQLHFFQALAGLRRPRAPARYLRALFDDYAERFDDHVMVDLAYAAPNLLRGIVGRRLDGPRPDGTAPIVVDLGCGTGICGPLFRPIAGWLVGVDLSPAMLARAEQRKVYDELVEAELIDFMTDFDDKADLCIAADVLIYFGDLTDAFAAVAAGLAAGGTFAFTLESDDGPDWVLRRSGRYAHGRDYVGAVARGTGFAVEQVEAATLRTHRGEPVAGDVWLLRRGAA